MGVKRVKTFGLGESFREYPFVFSTRTFFPSTKGHKWSGLGNETLGFGYYLVQDKAGQKLYYLKDHKEKPKIEDREVIPQHHEYEVLADDYRAWQELFTRVQQEILAGKVEKVVISREVKIQCTNQVASAGVLKNLLQHNPQSFVFAYSKEGKTFLGATPEILVGKEGEDIFSYALAGTRTRNSREGDEEQKAALLNDTKNRHEHFIVRDYIAKIMGTYGEDVRVGETVVLGLKNLYHLQTLIRAKTRELSLVEWVTRLHPTPALGGYPVQEALAIIADSEKHERGLYAAPLGIMNGEGDGIFVAGIRSALIEGDRVYAYTGCGIVESSDCYEEYLETGCKAKTILESL